MLTTVPGFVGCCPTDGQCQSAEDAVSDQREGAGKQQVSAFLRSHHGLPRHLHHTPDSNWSFPHHLEYGILLDSALCSLLTLPNVLGRININDADDKKHRQAEVFNNFVVVAIFCLTVVNISIAAFGISTPTDKDT